MKNGKSLSIFILVAMIISAVFAGVNVVPAFAQDGCTTDPATGAVNCPPTEESSTDSGGSSNPPPSVVTVTPSPVPTATPLPLALPESDYLGSCTSENFKDCYEQFKCEDGTLVVKVDLYTGDGTKYDFYCIPHKTVLDLGLPLTSNPDSTESTGWQGFCMGGDDVTESCINGMNSICISLGGEPSSYSTIDEDIADHDWTAVGCNGVPSPGHDSQGQAPAPTEALPMAAPEESGPAKPNGIPWGPVGIAAVLVVILIVLLLPAVQKLANKPNDPNPQTREHVLLNKDNGGTEAHSDYLIKIDTIDGETKHKSKAKLSVRKTGTDQND